MCHSGGNLKCRYVGNWGPNPEVSPQSMAPMWNLRPAVRALRMLTVLPAPQHVAFPDPEPGPSGEVFSLLPALGREQGWCSLLSYGNLSLSYNPHPLGKGTDHKGRAS